MRDEKNQGSRTDMKLQTSQGLVDIAQQLVGSARITGLPDKAFFRSFTPRRRREIVYNVDAQAGAFTIRLEVHGSGRMKAQVTMACVSIEDGVIHECNDMQTLSWAHNGEEADLITRLDHRHLEDFPCPHDVMGAFIEAIDTQKRAFCQGGFMQWRAMMQLFANRVAGRADRCKRTRSDGRRGQRHIRSGEPAADTRIRRRPEGHGRGYDARGREPDAASTGIHRVPSAPGDIHRRLTPFGPRTDMRAIAFAG